jgi:O-antigen chain-terminating methyltransferase
MDTIEIKDEEIDVEDIMRKIRENIKKRKESGAYSKEMEAMINEPLQPPLTGAGDGDLQSDLNYINSNWDINAEYAISSHRKIIGKPLVWGRRLIHSETKRYVDLVAGKQIEFNAHVAGAFKGLDANIDAKINAKTNAKINEAMADIKNDTDCKINAAMAALNKDIENKAWLASILEKRIKKDLTQLPGAPTDDVMNYFLFEEKFRGSTEDIKNRQSIYLEYFKNCRNVLDIGCGRGEFLSLMKENGIGASGIDMNEDMVLYCQKNGLEVSQNNALSYLTSLSDKTLDGIFSAQVVEHLQPAELINMVKLSYDKLQYGSYFIAETINPLCVMATQWFYLDLSHVRLIHPDTMRFVMESVGFRDIDFKFFSPVPEESKLKKLDLSKETGEDRTKSELINQNIDKLNKFLYGNQDYAVIGKK